jgi:hypothetical protein
MASVKMSGIGITAASGSIGDDVITFNAYGQYIKKKAPQPPGSPWLTAWQAVVADFTRAWSSFLSEQDRKLWYQFQYPVVNALAEVIMLSGFQAYMKCNLQAFTNGGSFIQVPPTDRSAPFRIYSPARVSAYIFTVHSEANQDIVLYATRPLSMGRQSFKQQYALLSNTSVTAGLNSIDIQTIYKMRVNPAGYAPGSCIMVKCQPVNPNNGFTLPPVMVKLFH